MMEKKQVAHLGTLFWLALVAFVGLAAAITLQLALLQITQVRSAAEAIARDDLRLLRVLLGQALQRQDYPQIRTTLGEWGRIREDCAAIRLVADNGSVLGEYRRAFPPLDPLRLRDEIPYSLQGRAQLELVSDLAPAERAARRLRVDLLVGIGGVTVAFMFLLWTRRYAYRNTLQQRHQADQAEQAQAALGLARQETAELRARLDAVLDVSSTTLVLVNAQGGIVEWNRGAEETTHIRREDALGLSFTELFPNVGRQIKAIGATLAAGAGAPDYRARMTSVSGGTLRYSNLLVRPLSATAQRGGLIRIEDVTQRVHFEQIMLQIDKTTALGGLARCVAHEINNPLSGVLQNCQNVLRRLSSGLADNRQAAQASGVDLERLQDYLEQRKILELLHLIRGAAERVGQIVADMLAFGRSDGGGFEPVAVAELLDRVLRLSADDYDMSQKYDFRRVQVIRDLAPDLPPLQCDRIHIEQALLNLIRNAAQTMAQAETPLPRRLTLRARVDGDHLLMEVEDTGPALSEAARRRVFEPLFSRGEDPGRGLGLSVAHSIVAEQHQGNLSVRSSPGQGNCFVVRVPLRSSGTGQSAGFSKTA